LKPETELINKYNPNKFNKKQNKILMKLSPMNINW